MSQQRQQVLSAVTAALSQRGVGGDPQPRPTLAHHRVAVEGCLREQFAKRAVETQTGFACFDTHAGVVAWLSAYLAKHQIEYWNLEWAKDTIPELCTLSPDIGPAQAHHELSFSKSVGAIAETGSIVLTSNAKQAVCSYFLPKHHIVLVRESELYANLEQAWQALQNRQVPRTMNFITGPSRTADIEQTIVLGAHGPQALHVLMLTN